MRLKPQLFAHLWYNVDSSHVFLSLERKKCRILIQTTKINIFKARKALAADGDPKVLTSRFYLHKRLNRKQNFFRQTFTTFSPQSQVFANCLFSPLLLQTEESPIVAGGRESLIFTGEKCAVLEDAKQDVNLCRRRREKKQRNQKFTTWGTCTPRGTFA